ncbi:unnamed protein product [Knipowitschia caucasica]
MLARCRINPWIEKLIVSFDKDESASIGSLKAHVIGVGHMSQSQALGSEGPTGLLFLSDEQVQIPAVLTASAWENLQDHEDKECFNSLLNTTVGIQDYKMQFHMSSEQTRCRFYLLVGKMVTTAAGVRDNTPSCTSLPSVRNKICETWRAMLRQQDDTPNNESGFNLTALLDEWQHDCLQTELEHIREKLSANPQRSISINATAMSDPCTVTQWDVDSVHFKGINCFSVPVHLLLIPDSAGQTNLQSTTHSDNVTNSQPKQYPEIQPTSLPETGHQSTSGDGPNSIEFAPFVLSATDVGHMSNPWDMCPPPSNTSSTKTSPEASPVQQNPIFTKAVCPLDIGSQISSHPEGSQREITAEPSLFPPFQKPIASTTSSSASANTLSSLSRVANPGCSAIQESTDGHFTQKCKGSLRCRSVDVDVSVILDEEEQKDRSPPSWLFDSQRGGTSQQNTSQTQGPPAGQTNTVYPCVHADGRPFSYTYQVRGHELLHFSSFTVQQDLQQWAVRYLLRPAHAEQIRDL